MHGLMTVSWLSNFCSPVTQTNAVETSYLSAVYGCTETIVNNSSVNNVLTTVLIYQVLLDSDKTRSEISKFSTERMP